MREYRQYQEQGEPQPRTMDLAVQFLLQREADRKMRLAPEAFDAKGTRETWRMPSELLVTEQAARDLARWFAKVRV